MTEETGKHHVNPIVSYKMNSAKAWTHKPLIDSDLSLSSVFAFEYVLIATGSRNTKAPVRQMLQ